jgi:hypothetical protein
LWDKKWDNYIDSFVMMRRKMESGLKGPVDYNEFQKMDY